MYVCVWFCVCKCRCLRRPEEGLAIPGAEVTGHCKPSNIHAGIQTPVFCKGVLLTPQEQKQTLPYQQEEKLINRQLF